MKSKNIFVFFIILLFSNIVLSQEKKFSIEECKKIDRNEFIEIQKENPKIIIKSIFENVYVFKLKWTFPKRVFS